MNVQSEITITLTLDEAREVRDNIGQMSGAEVRERPGLQALYTVLTDELGAPDA